uniref:Major facilitator superfamily (MFS) profile domain-containing protein n=1 Tax=Plectus sambesii TaxID=2011161 RepID=A0A914WD23_9BILA
MSNNSSLTTVGALNADKVLDKLGRWNRFGLSAFLLTNSIWALAAMQMMTSAFIADVPHFECRSQSAQEQTISANNSCVYDDHLCGANNNSHFVFDKEFGETIVSEFQLVCERESLGEWSTSGFMVGIMVGGLTLPTLADRYGRRPVLLVAVWFMGIFGQLSALAPSYTTFVIARFLAGSMYAGATMITWVLACESVAPRTRAYGTVLMGVFWTAGYVLLSPMAYYIRNWRWLITATSLPVLGTIVFIWTIPESLHWLIANGKDEQTRRWLRMAERKGGVRVTLEDCLDDRPKPAPERRKQNLLHLLQHPTLVVRTIIIAYLWLCDTFVYYGLSLFITKLAGDRFINFALSGAAELPAYFIAPPLLNLFGRKWVVGGTHLLSGVSLLGLLFVPNDQMLLSVALWLLGKFAIACAFTCTLVYGAEVFPTTVRSAGMGICGVISRFGGIIAPHVRTMEALNPILPPLFFGVLSLVGALVTLALPETLNRKLPEDIEDVTSKPLLKAEKTSIHL